MYIVILVVSISISVTNQHVSIPPRLGTPLFVKTEATSAAVLTQMRAQRGQLQGKNILSNIMISRGMVIISALFSPCQQ